MPHNSTPVYKNMVVAGNYLLTYLLTYLRLAPTAL